MAGEGRFRCQFRLIGSTQLGDRAPRTGHLSGLQGLMLAVLQEAVASYLGGRERLRIEAETWIWSGHATGPFAFSTVCETLGLAPDAVRAVLKGWRTQQCPHREVAGRLTRQNVRRAGRIRPRDLSRSTPPGAGAPRRAATGRMPGAFTGPAAAGPG